MHINKAASGSRSPVSKQIVSASVLFALILQSVLFALPMRATASPQPFFVSSNVVISQVYGGGGNSGATYRNDFVELFNKSSASVSVNGWSIQYASATGTGNFGSATNLITPLPNVSIQAGGYLLVQEASGGASGVLLPTADVTDATPIDLAAGAGKVALVNTTTPLGCNGGSTPCTPAQLAPVVDLVGYGNANFSEVAAAPTISATLANFRDGGGCIDTDNNANDFSNATAPVSPGTPAPRNSSSPLNACGVTNNPPSINAPADPAATVVQNSAPFTVNLSGLDDGAVYNWSATPGTGITSVAVSNGQSTTNVTYTVTLQAGFSGTATFTASLSDGVNTPATTRTVNIAVTPLVTNNPPVVTAPANPITTVAQDAAAFNVGLTGTDDNNIFNWSATAGTGISAVTVASGQGTSAVSYSVTLQSGFSGTATFTARLSDNVNPTVTQQVNITVTPAPSVAGTVAISQVYGGGGNTGSTLKNDYIELINRSPAPVNLNGWSVQVFSTTTSSWVVTPLTNVTLQPGQYYLVQEATGGGGTQDLPAADASGSITMSATSSKVAVVNSSTALTGNCPTGAGIADFVGYGTSAGCFEGSGPAPTLTNTSAALRLDAGCFDTNDNAIDFVAGGPDPHNTSSPTHDCTGVSGFGSASPSTVLQGQATTLTVHVAAGQNPSSTGITVVGDLSPIGGSSTQAFVGAGNTFTFTGTVPADNAPGLKSIPITVSDAQARTFHTDIKLSVLPVIPNHIVISQVYGGGGNANAPYTNDYVELYNPTDSTVNITGWTLQYASATGTTWGANDQPLGGVIGSHQYYLVQFAGGAVGAPLPVTPNISGGLNMGATAGKIALVRNSDPLNSSCPVGIDQDLVDFVGFGTTANCHEGNANTPAPSNTLAIFRKNGGDTDTDQNGNDFVTGSPNPRRTEPVVELGPWVAGTDPTTDDNTIPHDASITVNFSEPVDVDPSWYNISCAISGLHNDATVAHTGDFKTYAITPNINFQFGEQCSVSIVKTAVHDQDTDDSGPDTDTLIADQNWSFTVVGAGQPAPYDPSVHLTMGNPTNAVANTGDPLNYLMMKPTYAVSYNRDKGTPNWVSWHLDSSWYGSLARVDTFRPDPAVPADWYRVEAFDFSGTGFDRGHMTPNADRDNQNRIPINQETYLMSNMVPQSPDNNQGPWAAMEAALRTIADGGNELYIVSGPAGVGGGSSNGGTTSTIANGHVTVPSATWKVALVLPKADGDDISRVTCATQTIAVIMPNVQGIRNNDWHQYITTVDAVEQLTGYDFFSNLPQGIQGCVEAGTNGTNPPGAADDVFTTSEDSSVNVTLTALPISGNPIIYTVQNGPSHGSLSGTGANRVYTPQPDFNGSDNFTFTVTQDGRTSRAATVSLNVTQVNDAPVAVSQTVTTNEDAPAAITLSATDIDSSTLTYAFSNPSHGSLSGTAPNLTYTPDADFNGSDNFTFTANDGALNSNVATVSITVNAANDAPVAASQSVATDEDTAKAVVLAANDVDSGSLTYLVVSGPAHGTLSGTAPNLTYTPVADYNGGDSFTFKANDGSTDSNIATVAITINPVNDVPVAGSQSVATDEDTAKGITLSANDVDSPSLTYSVASGPSHGTLSGTAPNLTYTPAADYNGGDSFTFKANDGAADSNIATVTITVNAVNDAPTAGSQSVTTDEDMALGITLAATDVDSPLLTYSVVAGPAHGILSGTAPNLTYTPAADYNGGDSFTFKANDGSADSNIATVTITVNAVNDAPVAASQSVTTDEDTAKGITLAATDIDSPSLTYSVVSGPAHGALSGTAPNLTYTPAADYNGGDSFTFTANDGSLASNTATVSIMVNAVNDPPTATNLSAPEAYIINTSLDLTDIVVTDIDSSVTATLTLSDHAAGSLTIGTSGSTTSTYDAATGVWTASGPPAEVNALLANVSFAPAANFSSDFSIATTVTDGSVTLNGLKPVIVIDTQAPTTSPTQSPAPNGAGWNNTNVSLTLTATDNPGGSGVSGITYSATGAQSISQTTVSGSSANATISAEGTTTITYFATDNKGNSESSHTLTVKVDKTGPGISSSRTPSANAAGWNNTDVTANYTASDAGSGLDAGSPASGAYVFSGEGAAQLHTFTVTDIAGNSTSSTITNVNIDKTAPLFISFPGDQNLTATSNNGASAVWPQPTAGDNLSGVASIGCSAASGSVFPIGTTSVSCSTADAAGNVRTQGFTINVVKAISHITVSAPANTVNGGNAILSAVLTGTGNAPLAGRSIAFSLGSGPATQTCTAVTAANGSASCTITNISQPNGSSVLVTATFSPTGGDAYYLGSSATTNVSVNGTAVVTRHRPTLNGGTVTGGLRVLLGEAFNVNSGTTLTDLYLVGTPTLTRNNGSFGTIVSDGGAATPTGYQVTLNGGNITSTHRQSDAVAFPADIPSSVPSPTATRQVTINSPSDISTIGNWATLKSLTINTSNLTINVPAGNYYTFTLNGGNIKLIFGAGTYNFANTIVLNNNSNIEFGAPATVNIASPLTLNSGKMLVGSGIGSSDVKLNVLGTVTLNSNSEIDAELRVPNGAVIFNGGNALVKGNIWADGFTLNSNSQVVCNYCINP